MLELLVTGNHLGACVPGPALTRNCYFVFYVMIQPDLETASV